MKFNLHTHTVRCKHAQDPDAQYVKCAIRAGFSDLGFSDHGPLPYADGYISHIRMGIGETEGYLGSIDSLRARFEGQIRLHTGFEYEYFPAFAPFLRDEILPRVDYLILGNHFDLDERTGMYFGACRTPADIRLYLKRTVAGMQSGLYRYLAHPDLFLYAYPSFDAAAREVSRELCRAAKALGMPLEYNLLGVEKQRAGVPGLGYPCRHFFEVAAEEGATALIGVDAHRADALESGDFDDAEAYLGALGLARIGLDSLLGEVYYRSR